MPTVNSPSTRTFGRPTEVIRATWANGVSRVTSTVEQPLIEMRSDRRLRKTGTGRGGWGRRFWMDGEEFVEVHASGLVILLLVRLLKIILSNIHLV